MTRFAPLAVVLALPALAVPVHAAAQASPAAAPALDSERQALGYELARLLAPPEFMSRAIDTMTPENLLADPNLRQAEGQYPGLAKALAEAMQPVARRVLDRQMPALWQRLGALHARSYTIAELRELTRFFGSPLGLRSTRVMLGGDFEGMVQTALRQGKAAADRKMDQDLELQARKLEQELTPQENAQVNRFMESPVGRKHIALQDAIEAEVGIWSKETNPSTDPEFRQIVTETARAYIAAHGGPK